MVTSFPILTMILHLADTTHKEHTSVLLYWKHIDQKIRRQANATQISKGRASQLLAKILPLLQDGKLQGRRTVLISVMAQLWLRDWMRKMMMMRIDQKWKKNKASEHFKPIPSLHLAQTFKQKEFMKPMEGKSGLGGLRVIEKVLAYYNGKSIQIVIIWCEE